MLEWKPFGSNSDIAAGIGDHLCFEASSEVRFAFSLAEARYGAVDEAAAVAFCGDLIQDRARLVRQNDVNTLAHKIDDLMADTQALHTFSVYADLSGFATDGAVGEAAAVTSCTGISACIPRGVAVAFRL